MAMEGKETKGVESDQGDNRRNMRIPQKGKEKCHGKNNDIVVKIKKNI